MDIVLPVCFQLDRNILSTLVFALISPITQFPHAPLFFSPSCHAANHLSLSLTGHCAKDIKGTALRGATGMRKIVALNMGETKILDILEEGEMTENALGDPCSICQGPSGYSPIRDEFEVTFWICDRCDAPMEWRYVYPTSTGTG